MLACARRCGVASLWAWEAGQELAMTVSVGLSAGHGTANELFPHLEMNQLDRMFSEVLSKANNR